MLHIHRMNGFSDGFSTLRGAALLGGMLAARWAKALFLPRPIIHRAAIYDFLPQLPTWFLDAGHAEAKLRFLRKLRQTYRLETLRACPFCSCSRLRLLATQERTGIPTSVVICLGCSLVFTDRQMDESAMTDHYQRDYREIERGTRDDLHQFMFNLQRSKGPGICQFLKETDRRSDSGTTMADIGSGEGGLVAWFNTEGHFAHSVGFELNQQAADYGRSRGIDIRNRAFLAGTERYDLIVMEQVLEHIRSPADLLANIAASQEPGAWLYIGVPGILNSREHYADNFLAYLQYGHMFHYSLHTLERIIVPFGYQLIRGDETVRAAFRRTTERAPQVRTEMKDANSLVQFLLEGENAFIKEGSHFRHNWRAYLDYLKLLLSQSRELW